MNDLDDAIADAVDELWRAGERGDILVFLPGEREIRETADHLRKHLASTQRGGPPAEILPLVIAARLICSRPSWPKNTNTSGRTWTRTTEMTPHFQNRACLPIATSSLKRRWKIFWVLPMKKATETISMIMFSTRKKITLNSIRKTIPDDASFANCR